jgi:uncharacterized protein YndB with AHSA1/START domain
MQLHAYEPVTPEFLLNAPVQLETTVVIDAPREEVFRVLEDGESWPKWVGAITRVDWTSPKPFEVGTTRTVYMQGNQVADEEFFLWEQNQRMAFYFLRASFDAFRRFAEDYQLEDPGGNRTRLTWTFAADPRGIHKVIMTVLRPVMKLYLKKILKDLKRYVEERQS